MFKNIRIANFRGIKEGTIEDLARINILVGQNNSGKSTVLEALILARAPIRLVDKLGRHGIQDLLKRRVSDRAQLDFRELWYRLNTENKIELGLEFADGNATNTKITYSNWEYELEGRSREGPLFKEIFHVRPIDDYVETIWGGGSTVNFHPTIIRELKQRFSFSEENAKALGETMLIDADYIHKMESVERSLWQDIKAQRKDIEIRQTLNETYNLDIENLSFIPFVAGKFKLYTEMPNYSVPIDDLGEGFRYALAILSTMVMLEHTALLIEELEVHQHPEALNRLLTAIFKVAKRNDIQLFITTQSLELINYALEVSEKENLEIKLYHLSLDKNGTLSTRGISAPDAKLLADVGPDVRLLHKYVAA